jgi:Mce-associated membrane protein
LITTVVVPEAKQKGVSASAQVPAAAVVSADNARAVVLAYVNQSLTVGTAAPTQARSSVRVTMDNVDGRWLISGFDPI